MVTGVFVKFGCTLIIEAIKAATKPAAEAVKYVLHCERNIKKLETEMGKLEGRMKIIERDVNEAINRGEVIEEEVSRWQTETNTMKIYVLYLTNQSTVEAKIHCFACSCPNIKWRYLLSKQAEKKTADLKDLTQESYKFNKVSHRRPRPQELEYPSNENYVDFDSRKQILKDIVNALKKSDGNVIGIHGLGGVGKTTLAVEVAKKMRDDGTFKQFALATVSKDFNVRVIQEILADELNCKFGADGVRERAHVLWDFLNVGKYLVILDDIWEKVDLKEIGIPITDGKTGSKVVLTSRNKDLLVERMNVNNHVSIGELPEAEAWVLFKKKLGNSTESMPDIDSRAYEVCKKCKGLPVAINALAAALKGKPDYAWVNAINKLESYMLTNIEGVNQNVSASLRLSYDMLSSDAKSCFLLCCFFPEDTEILVDDLVRQCLVRSLLSQNPRTLEEARNAVRTEVHSLKSVYLLSNGNDDNVIRVHDVIRDVGISIARKEGVLVDHDAVRWPRNPVNRNPYSAISLRFKKFKGLPNKLTYPKLHTLMFCNNKCSNLEIPDTFFSGMKKLTVLNLSGMRMQQLPSSLAKLASLGMLCLEHCELPDLAVLGDLKNSLEVLSLRGSDIKALPKEIGQLTSLLLLDLRDCKDLKVIPQGVISKLISLEEFYLNTFDKWEATIDEEKDTSRSRNVSIEEIRLFLNTVQLTTLHIHIPTVSLLPKEDLMLKYLKRFRISMGSKFDWYDDDFPGTRVLKYAESSLRKEFIPLVDKAEALHLSGIKGLKKVLDYRGVGNEFLDLKYLNVESCDDDLEYLLGEPKSSVQSHELYPFKHLTDLIVEKCKFKYLFSPTTARGLVHLEHLKVVSCENMEEIVGFEGQNDGNELILSKLKSMSLDSLPNLTSFYAGKEKTRTPMESSSARAQPLFTEKVILPVLEELKVEALDSIEEIWDKQSPSVNQETESFGQLRNIEVEGCKKLMNLIPSNILPRLRNLQFLEVDDCPNVEFVVFKNKKGEEEVANDSTLIIPQLSWLSIRNMGKLKRFYSSSTTSNAQSLFNHQVILPVLEHLKVEALNSIEEIWDKQSPSVNQETESFGQLRNIEVKGCKKLMNLVPSNILPRLRNLQDLAVRDCPNVEFVVFKNKKGEEEAANDSTLIIPQLRRLEIRNLEKLKSFYASSTTSNSQSLFNHQVIFPVLERLDIWGVDNIIEIWDKQSIAVFEAQGSFCQLMNVEVTGFNKLTHLFPSKMHPLLKNLKKLEVGGCETMEGVVGFEGELDEDGLRNEQVCFSQLTSLRLKKLPKLVSFCTKMEEAGTTEGNPTIHAQPLFNGKVIFPILEELKVEALDSIEEIWDKQPPSVNQEMASFGQLSKIEVKKCMKLMNLVPLNMLPRLQNLQDLRVEWCSNVEFVVFKNGNEEEAANDSTLIIPQLRRLAINKMEKLKSFYSSSTTSNAQSLFNHQVIFPVLEKLEIVKLDNIIEIWDKQSIRVFEARGSFCKLMNMDVDGCNKLTHLFPSKMHPLLKNLKVLQVDECETMEGVVGFEEELDEDGLRNEQVCFSKLTSLHLSRLPKLVSFCTKMGEAGTTEGNPTIHAQPLFNGKSIRVWKCDPLEYVLPSYMLPELHNLLELDIGRCRELEVIVSNKLKEKEATNNDILVFPQLKTLTLYDLDNLKCFCTGTDQLLFSHKVAFPALEDLQIWNMPSITEIWDKTPVPEPEKEIESFGELATIDIYDCPQLVYLLPSYMIPHLQNLQRLEIGNCKEVEVIVSKELMKEKEAVDNDPIVFSQLNDVVFSKLPKLKSFYTGTQLFFSDKVAFPALEHLSIKGAFELKEIWDKQPVPEPENEAKSFCKLERIVIEFCGQLVYVLPSYMVPKLQNLQELVITNCKEMEVIISNKPNDIILFAELKTVKLQILPNLKRLCAETQLGFCNKDAFPKLKEIDLDDDLEFLQNGTSTKEECSTSGKENDHNAEEG